MKTLEEWHAAQASKGYILVMKDEGTVYVLHRETKDEALEQLRLYEKSNLFEETQLKEVDGLDLANQCDFETYPDGSFILVGSDSIKLPQKDDDLLLSDLRRVLDEYEFEEEVQPIIERVVPHIEGLIRERNGAETCEQLLEDQVSSLKGNLQSARDAKAQLEHELASAEAEADDWMEMMETAEGRADELREELTRGLDLNKELRTRVVELETLVEWMEMMETAEGRADELREEQELRTRVVELETLVENGDKIMSEEQLHNSHDDLPSAKELKNSTAALNKAAKNLILSHCNVCNKTLKNPKGLAQHLRDTKCGVIDAKKKWDQQAVTAGCQPVSLPTEAKWAYQRDAVKWNALNSSFETLVRYSALAFAVYHVAGIF
jgi:hypothetical protein